jgi:NAD(P)-dependent dehydrogenase (short-subunit alcohol dehydrogenase family)
MLEAGIAGAIVHVTSQMGHVGAALRTVYCAAKHAVEGLTKAMAVELAPHGIRVNAVCPGTVDTPLLAAEFATAPDPTAERRLTEDSIALGRIARPEEIARLVVFLLSDESSYVTGSEFVADGGRTGCYPTADVAAGAHPRERHEVTT